MGDKQDHKELPSVTVTIRDGNDLYHINLTEGPGNPFPFRVVSTGGMEDLSGAMNMQQFQRALGILQEKLDPAKLQAQHRQVMARTHTTNPAVKPTDVSTSSSGAGASKPGSISDIIYGNAPPKKNT